MSDYFFCFEFGICFLIVFLGGFMILQKFEYFQSRVEIFFENFYYVNILFKKIILGFRNNAR